ncbi:FecR family protein [Sphingobacterium sp. N143]|uniref:FecR family protein n=1 Tax=Sphingobacterium sp. N143 TaxID=2746727 RepID=UPI002575D249|nr:FecR family protein [Sphingobacterium sp. N143]MDM1294182.1 FecR family protein [Sphingobacterium sp. N143]
MKEESFKYQLVEYIHNRLDISYYETFFDAMAQMDRLQLQGWIDEVLEQMAEEPPVTLPDLSAVHQKVLENIYSIDPPQRKGVKWMMYWAWGSCAAILICVCTWLYWLSFSDHPNTGDKTSLFWYENKHAYVVSMQLPDSSTVILYPNAKISFERNKLGNRMVQQQGGRVIYKVRKNPEAPFQVNYRDYITTALGTIFSVEPKPAERVLIKLMEGRVSVGPGKTAAQQLVYLEPHEEVLVDLRSNRMIKSSERELKTSHSSRVNKKLEELIPSLKANIAWTNQSVSFNQTKNIQLLQVIESLYDVSVICESPELLTNSFTGSLNRKEPLEKFFTNFCQLNGCSFKMDNGIVHLSNLIRKEGTQ